MTDPTDNLISELARELEPVKVYRPGTLVLLWLAASMTYVAIAMSLTGSLRPGVASQLLQPGFGTEMLAGLTTIVLGAICAFKLATPGSNIKRLVLVTFAAAALWVGVIVSGFIEPILEPSMAGKRPHCAFEAFGYSIPPLMVLLFLINKGFPTDRYRALTYGAIASGLLPAVGMQVACMHEPGHALLFHIGPAIGLALATLGSAAFYFHHQQGASA